MGLVNRVVPPGGAREAAVAWDASSLPSPRTAFATTDSPPWPSGGSPLRTRLRVEFDYGLASLRSPDADAGARRFSSGAGRGGSAVGTER